MKDVFRVTEQELFELWKEYNKKIHVGFSARIITHMWQKSTSKKNTKAIDYFTAIGLELFNKTYLEVVGGK